jgi:hypothetical protein
LNSTTDFFLPFVLLFFFQNLQTGPEPHPVSYSMSRGFFLGGNLDGA